MSGLVGPHEIEEMLISLGLAKTREEVYKVVSQLDDNGSGELDFDEFLQLLKESSMMSFKQQSKSQEPKGSK